MKKNNGITLIALIISIVVLIILASVAINTLINNGIIDKAKTATQEYKNAQDYEETQISKYTNEINSYVSGNRDYESEINTLKARITELENLNSYSTSEKLIGTWVDGKLLYERTYSVTSPSTVNVSTDVADLPTDYETVFITNAFIIGSTSTPLMNFMDSGGNYTVWLRTKNNSTSKNKITMLVPSTDVANKPAYITIRYTKTPPASTN